MAFVDDGVELVAGGAVFALFKVQVEILIGFWANDAIFSVEEWRGVGTGSGAGFEGLIVFFEQLGGVLCVIWRNAVLEIRDVRFGDDRRPTGLSVRIVYIASCAGIGADIKVLITRLANTFY